MTRIARRANPSARSALRGIGVMALAATLLVAGCAKYEPSQQRLTVAPDPVDCANGTPGACIRVTAASGDVWITRPGEITGFTYEPGFTYELLVEAPSEVSEIESPEMLRPALIRVLSKQAAGAPALLLAEGLDQAEWLLTTVTPSDYTEAEWAASRITARFDVGSSRLSGFAGCNDYLAEFAVTGDQLQVAAPGSTRKACAPETIMALEQEYLMRIARAAAFVVTPGRLELSLADGSGMAFQSAAQPPDAAR